MPNNRFLVAQSFVMFVLPLMLVACTTLIPPIDPLRVGATGDTKGGLEDGMSPFASSLSGKLPNQTAITADKTFFGLYTASINDPTDSAKSELYFDTGLALSDQLCSEWFDKLGQAQVRDATTKDLIGGVGALSAVLMSASQASSQAIGVVAATTGFAQRSIDSATENYIVAPDLGIVKRAIIIERALAADQATAQLKATPSASKFAVATQLLIGYDNLCSHIEIKRIVNESVSAQANAAANKTGLSEFYPSLIQSAVQDLKGMLSDAATVDGDAVIALYGLKMVNNNLTDAAKGSYTELLTNHKIMDSNGNILFKTGGTEAKLNVVLTNANALGDLDKKLALDKSLKPASVALPAETPSTPSPASASSPAPASELAPVPSRPTPAAGITIPQ